MPMNRVTLTHPVTKATVEVAASAVKELEQSGWKTKDAKPATKAPATSTAKPRASRARKPKPTAAAKATATTASSSQPAPAPTEK